MQKPRPKEARGLRQQRSARENRGPHKGASAPFAVPGGETTPNQCQMRTSSASEVPAKPAGTEAAVIVFGFNAYRIP